MLQILDQALMEEGGAVDYSLGEEVWAKFIENFWMKKRPTVIKKALSGPLLSADEIFSGIAQLGHLIKKERTGKPRLYIEANLLDFDLGSWLPSNVETDKGKRESWIPTDSIESLSQWIQFVSDRINGRNFGLVVNNFHLYAPVELKLRLKKFLKPLYNIVGMPENVEPVLFLSHYDKTPFGVHKDRAEIFCFVLSGTKKMRVWPLEVFKDRCVSPVNEWSENQVHITEYEDDLESSILLEGEPGDILYWPASYWHIAESSLEDHSITLSLPLDYKNNGVSVSKILGQRALRPQEAKSGRVNVPFPGINSSQPITVTAEAVSDAKAFLEEIAKADVETEIVRTLLDKQTSYSIAGGNRPVHGKVNAADVIFVSPESPLLYERVKDGLVVSSDGQSFVLPYNPQLIELLELLNKGDKLKVSEIGQRLKNGLSAGNIGTLLGILYENNGIFKERVRPSVELAENPRLETVESH